MPDRGSRIHVSLVALPDAMVSPVTGLYEMLNAFAFASGFEGGEPQKPPFKVEIVAPTDAPDISAGGLHLRAHRSVAEVERTDIVIVPVMMVTDGEWTTGRYAEVVDWLKAMHAQGAMLCSACTGVLILAETGLLDGREATIHWAFAPIFHRNFPQVTLRLEEVLVTAGDRQELVMSGATASWHDLVLYLIARHIGPTAAQMIARFMLLQWHPEGQAPYITFRAPTAHGDAVVAELQKWLQDHFSVASPVEEMLRHSGLPRRSFERRFKRATGYSPIAYVQHLRIEEAKRRLERTGEPIDAISWEVGYEDPAFFRRLFKRVTRLTPGDYRRRFHVPKFSMPEAS